MPSTLHLQASLYVNFSLLFIISNLKVKKTSILDKKHTYFTSKLCVLVEDSFYDRRGDFIDFLETFNLLAAGIFFVDTCLLWWDTSI